jgi:hypothetical protein
MAVVRQKKIYTIHNTMYIKEQPNPAYLSKKGFIYLYTQSIIISRVKYAIYGLREIDFGSTKNCTRQKKRRKNWIKLTKAPPKKDLKPLFSTQTTVFNIQKKLQ